MSTFTDLELVEFLDGRLAGARGDEIVEALSRDPVLETRLMALDGIAPVLQGVFEQVGRTRVRDYILPDIRAAIPSPRSWRPTLIAASVAAAVALFGTFNVINRGPDAAHWMQQVAAYQALYSPETIAAVTSTPSDLQAQLAQAETALNITLPKEALQQIEGLELRRTQMLAYQGQPLAQIVFSDMAGRPIALCILMTGDAPQSGVVDADVLEGLQSAAFSNDGFGFLLIGPTDASAIAGYADEIRGALAQI